MPRIMITGSFDPVTIGHEDIIRRAASIFSDVRVVVFLNPEKPGMFTPEERLRLLTLACAKYPNVTADLDTGMVIDYVKREEISLILRSVRDEKDLPYEMKMAEFNRTGSGVETLLLPADPALTDISSSELRRRITENEDYFSLLPEEIRKETEEIVKNRIRK